MDSDFHKKDGFSDQLQTKSLQLTQRQTQLNPFDIHGFQVKRELLMT